MLHTQCKQLGTALPTRPRTGLSRAPAISYGSHVLEEAAAACT